MVCTYRRLAVFVFAVHLCTSSEENSHTIRVSSRCCYCQRCFAADAAFDLQVVAVSVVNEDIQNIRMACICCDPQERMASIRSTVRICATINERLNHIRTTDPTDGAVVEIDLDDAELLTSA